MNATPFSVISWKQEDQDVRDVGGSRVQNVLSSHLDGKGYVWHAAHEVMVGCNDGWWGLRESGEVGDEG